jgi:hypothetical protein
MTKTKATINIATTIGFGPDLRSHLCEKLGDILNPDGGPVALSRLFYLDTGEITASDSLIAICASPSGITEQISLNRAPRALKDQCGGASYSITGDNDLFTTTKAEALRRHDVAAKTAYHLPFGVLLTSRMPLRALISVRKELGEEGMDTISDRALNGAFGAIINEHASHHEQIVFVASALMLFKFLIQRNAQAERMVRTPVLAEQGAQYDAVLAALDRTMISMSRTPQ